MKIQLILITGFYLSISPFCGAQKDSMPRLNASFDIHAAYLVYRSEGYDYQFNYGIGGSLSQHLSFGKLSFGVIYKTNHFNEEYSRQGHTVRNELRSSLVGLPLTFSYFLRRNEHIPSYFSPVVGIIPIRLNRYLARSYTDTIRISESCSHASAAYGSALLIRIGLNYYLRIGGHWKLFIGTFADFSLKDHTISPSHFNQSWYPLRDNQSTLNFSIGTEFFFKNQDSGK